jgi:hypothetical protein
MKTILPTTLALAFAMGSLCNAADAEPLSPYFEIHGEQRADVFPLKETHAGVTISGTIAQVTLTQTYTNDGEAAIDATYFFPASTGAAVNGMTMTIGDRVLTAKIARKEEARKTFEKAKSENKSASLLSQQRPNVFQMEVARIMPGDEVKLTLRYTELLVPTDGQYEFVLPTAIGPRYGGGGKAESFTENPYLGEGAKTVSTYAVDLAVGTPLPLMRWPAPRTPPPPSTSRRRIAPPSSSHPPRRIAISSSASGSPRRRSPPGCCCMRVRGKISSSFRSSLRWKSASATSRRAITCS